MKMKLSASSQTIVRARRAKSALTEFVAAITIELRRLNRARLDADELAGLAPRARRDAIKAAIAAHHRNNSRCC
jgi:hypothetical protein